MPKRLQQADGPPNTMGRHAGWSIDANGLTAAGQNELLKQIGRQLQTNYQNVLKEPAPDGIKQLLERLEARSNHADDEDS